MISTVPGYFVIIQHPESLSITQADNYGNKRLVTSITASLQAERPPAPPSSETESKPYLLRKSVELDLHLRKRWPLAHRTEPHDRTLLR